MSLQTSPGDKGGKLLLGTPYVIQYMEPLLNHVWVNFHQNPTVKLITSNKLRSSSAAPDWKENQSVFFLVTFHQDEAKQQINEFIIALECNNWYSTMDQITPHLSEARRHGLTLVFIR